MATVDPGDVEALTEGEIATIVPMVTVLAKSYTRGRGFVGNVPNQEIAAVICTAAARLAGNGTQLATRRKIDDVETEFRSFFSGWTIAEQIVLNRFRVRAQ